MTNEPRRDVGYRGALPIRDDRLARPWIIAVFAILVLVIVLSILGVPSRFVVAEETPRPLPSIPIASDTPEPTDSPSPSISGSGAASPSLSPSPEP